MSKEKKNAEINKEKLIELESRPKTKFQKGMDFFVCILPILCMGVALAEYCLVPDIRENYAPRNYVNLILFFLIMYSIWVSISLKNKGKMRKVRYKAPLFSVIALGLTLYDILTIKTGILMSPFFPCVNEIFTAMIEDRVYLWECTVSTLKLLMHGYCSGAVLGLITGVACGYSKRVNYWLSPIMKFLGPIPTTTWIPVIMVLAPTLYKGSVFVIALGVWYSVALATITGISNVEKSYFDAARTLGAKEHHMVLRIAIPYAIPNMFQGLTQGMTIACTALLVAEMMGTESGLGWYITWQKSWAMFANMYGAIILICIIFTVVTFVLAKIRKIFTKWKEGVVQ